MNATEGPRVLVVDDNHDAADSLAMLLRFWGYDTRVAYDGMQALAVAPAYRPDALCIDLGLPGLDGCEVARRLRPSLPRPPVLVAVTGYGDADHRRRAVAAGFDHFLLKPVDLDVLRRLLEAALRIALAGGPVPELVPVGPPGDGTADGPGN
jgi:CheY-like chemotaxis protein